MQQGLRDYLTAVYNDEVPQMAEGDIQLYSGGAHNSSQSVILSDGREIDSQQGDICRSVTMFEQPG